MRVGDVRRAGCLAILLCAASGCGPKLPPKAVARPIRVCIRESADRPTKQGWDRHQFVLSVAEYVRRHEPAIALINSPENADIVIDVLDVDRRSRVMSDFSVSHRVTIPRAPDYAARISSTDRSYQIGGLTLGRAAATYGNNVCDIVSYVYRNFGFAREVK